MNALLKPVTVKALKKPAYARWDLVRMNDMAAWIAANREALTAWYNDTNQYCDDIPELFAVFAADQFEFERAHFDELRSDAKLDHDYAEDAE